MEMCSEKFGYRGVSPEVLTEHRAKPSKEFFDKAAILQSTAIFAIVLHTKNKAMTDVEYDIIHPKLLRLKKMSNIYITASPTSHISLTYLESSITKAMEDIRTTLAKIEESIAQRNRDNEYVLL